MIIIRGCTDGSWAQLKLMASLALTTSFYIQVSKKKWGFLISWQHWCHTTRTAAGGLETPNKSFSHQPQTPLALTRLIPSHCHYTHPRGPETERGKSQESREERRRAHQEAEMLILDLQAVQRRKRSPPAPTSGTESMSCACVETRPRASVGVPAGEWLCCTRSGRLM